MPRYRLTFTGICIVDAPSPDKALDELIRIVAVIEAREPAWWGYRDWDIEPFDEEEHHEPIQT
jgi:hypothetical protein